MTHTPSQRYLSTRGEDSDFSFEDVVLKGLASDGGLFIPQEIPQAHDWKDWKDMSFQEIAFQVLSLYISRSEIPADDLRDIIDRSYSTFRAPETTPLVHLHDQLYLLELFHGPTFAFKDVALQFLGNLFEYFLVRKNQNKTGRDRHHLTVIGATSGDTGSAAIYGLRGKKDVSVFILHPKGRVSPIQEAQMTTVLDANVHNIAVRGTFDDCQDILKTLFGDAETNAKHHLGAVNSINWARILAQIVYYFHAYFSLLRANTAAPFSLGDKVRFVVPTGNFGDVLAGYFAFRMGLPVDKFVIATNENDILHRFWQTGKYEMQPAQPDDVEAHQGLAEDGAKALPQGAKETLSPAMDVLVSSNFERLVWFLAYQFAATAGMDDDWNKRQASQEVTSWLKDLKTKGGFGPVYQDVLNAARRDFSSERVSDDQTLATIREIYRKTPGDYVLDPHTAVGVTAAQRSMSESHDPSSPLSPSPPLPHISLATAHPAKFSAAVTTALSSSPNFTFPEPQEFIGLEAKEKRVTDVDRDWKQVRDIVTKQVEEELATLYT